MRTIVLTGAMVIGAACGGAAVDTYLHAAPSAIEIDSADEIPAYTDLLVALREPVGARVNGVGDRIAVDVVQAIATRDGVVVVPIGSTIHGRITAVARPATRGNQMAIAIRFDELMNGGKSLPIDAYITEIAPAPVWDQTRSVRTPAGAGVGKVLSSDDAISHTGIEVGGRNGSVIGLGVGDVEPVLYSGTRMTLETRSTIVLEGTNQRPSSEANAAAVVRRPQQPVAPGIGACGDDSVPAACYW